MLQRALDQCGRLDRSAFETDLTGFESGHFGRFFDQMIQAITLLVDDGKQLTLMALALGNGSEQISDGSFHAGKRRAEVMRDGVEESGLQALALTFGLGFADLFDGARALDGYGDKGADGVEGLARKPGAGNPEASYGFHAQAYGKEVQGFLRVANDVVTDKRVFHFLFIELRSTIA